MRLFVAVNFSETIKESLLKAIEELRAQSVLARYTRPENLHLTLAFIGETAELEKARRALEAVQSPRFDISLAGFGSFGNLLWVGLENSPELMSLASNVRNALLKEGFVLDNKPFRPHITIAREAAAKGVKLDIRPAGMRVEKISLMKSERLGGRLVYTEIFKKELE